jgi:hypothetical protein
MRREKPIPWMPGYRAARSRRSTYALNSARLTSSLAANSPAPPRSIAMYDWRRLWISALAASARVCSSSESRAVPLLYT